jgi:hypothetical protein
MTKLSERWETITPMRAQEMLNNSVKTRNIDRSRVRQFMRDMSTNNWKETGEPIQCNEEGKWMNGQHRCTACVESGVSFKTLVVYGVPCDALPYIDSGKSRSAADMLQIHGASFTVILAGAINWTRKIHSGKPLSQDEMTREEMLKWWKDHPEIDLVVEELHPIKKVMPVAMAVGFHWVLARINKEDADKLMHDLMNGTDLAPNDPVHILRERLLDIKLKRPRLNKADIPAMLIRTWNFRRTGLYGKKLFAARIHKGSPTLPEINGWTEELEDE